MEHTKEELSLFAAQQLVNDFIVCNEVPTAMGVQEHDMPMGAAIRCAKYHAAAMVRDTEQCPIVNLHWVEVQKALDHV